MANLQYYPRICLEGLGKTTKTLAKIVGASAEIYTEHLLNAGQKCYYMRQLAWWVPVKLCHKPKFSGLYKMIKSAGLI
jgi:hypothetical protein